MLRKRLLARLGLLVVGFVAGSVVAIAMLQGVLRELDAVNTRAEAVMDAAQAAVRAAGALRAAAAAPDASPAALRARAADASSAVDRVARSAYARGADAGVDASAGRLRALCAEVGGLLAGPLAQPPADLPGRSEALEAEASAMATLARRHAAAEQASLSLRLRTLIVALTVAALAMTNVAILVLVRTANMVLRPVGQLIEGSRELAAERWAHRIRVAGGGEFGELAGAYNALAERLASNEQRKVRALQHLAVTLNHELNNVINAIELQLRLVNRRAGADPLLGAQLADIHANLERMARTVASLRSVRRVVLTEYLPGEPMLDLPRSTAAEDPPPPGVAAGPPAGGVTVTRAGAPTLPRP